MIRKKKSIVKNSIFYMFYQGMNVLFPFITAMYVARILLPNTVGKVMYAQNIVSYFVTFAFLGIPTYGLREISKSRNKEELSKLFSELFCINAVSTMFFLIIYILIIFTVETFTNEMSLYLIVGGAIVLNFLNINWLFEGMEEFQYISLKNIIFKVICFFLLVIFVKNEKDYLIYALITVFGTAGNYIVNILYAKKFIKFTLKKLNFKRHLKPIFYLVVVNFAIELYSMVDTTMIGWFTTSENVAYYSYGQKIVRIFIQVVNSFTIVVVPRLALCFEENNNDEFNRLVSKTVQTIILLAVPIAVGIQIIGYDAIVLLYGEPFAASSDILKILSLILVVSPLGYLLGSRILLVTNHESKMIICVCVGAVVNIVGNLLLIPKFSEIGAAITSVISEVIVMLIYVIFGSKYFKLINLKIEIIKIVFATIIMGMIVFLFGIGIKNLILKIFIQVVISVIIYCVVLLILKEEIVKEYTILFIDKIKKYRKCV